MSKTMPAAEFEANCLALLDEVAKKQEEVVVLKDGKPLAKVIPASFHATRSLESLRASGTIVGDIMAPLDDEWTAAE